MIKNIIYKKSLYITSDYLNQKCLIYNGRTLEKLIISKDMIGYKFGEFINTRRIVKYNK
jgi:ribosomal protein S19